MSTEETANPDTAMPDPPASPLDALQKERDELQDRLLRITAEFDNYRKRTDRERREQAEFVTAEVMRDLLPVLDNLERALTAPVEQGPGAEAIATYRQGVEMIRRELAEVLRRRNVEPVEALGLDFNPEWHEAIASDPLDGRREGEITAEVRRGYRIGQRLIRAAMVKVAKG